MSDETATITYNADNIKCLNGRTFAEISTSGSMPRLLEQYGEVAFKSFFNTIKRTEDIPFAVFELKKTGIGSLAMMLVFMAFFNIGLLEAKNWYELMPLYIPLDKRVSEKLARITELSHQRPLLAREQYERDTLQKILTIASLDDISVLAEEISRQAIDPELKKRLLSLAEEKKQILDI
jgi:hypothetical protein